MGTTSASVGRRIPDPRLLVGIVLVMASVAGVVGLMAAVDRRVVVFAAAETLAPGDRIARSELLPRSVSLAEADGLYVTAADIPDGGLVAVRAVMRGELLPLSAVGDAADRESTALVVELAGSLSSETRVGTVVELWSSPLDPEGEGFGSPVVIVDDAVVLRVVESEGLMASAASAVEVRVPRDRVARILQAQADGEALAVVPAGLPLRAE